MGTRFTDHCSIHFSSRCKCFSLKCNSHSRVFRCWPTSSIDKTNPLLTLLHIFKRKMKFYSLLLFITGITRINKHFLKHKVVIFAEFLKHICERVNFSKVRGLTACNFSNNKYFHRYFSKILLNLIRQLLKKYFSMNASNKA